VYSDEELFGPISLKEPKKPCSKEGPLTSERQSSGVQSSMQRRYRNGGATIGYGSFGTLYLGLETKSMTDVALKVVTCQKFQGMAFDEYRIMSSLNHPNIIKAFDLVRSERNELIIVMEYASDGDLYSKVESGQLTESLARKYFSNVIDGLEYLHNRGIVHRDIKLDNVVISCKDEAKICDFGSACRESDVPKYQCGSRPYMAPEVFDLDKMETPRVHRSQDVWSMGIMLYAMLTGEFPWDAAVKSDMDYSRFCNSTSSYIHKHEPWNQLSYELVVFLRQVLSSFMDRCSTDELKQVLLLPTLYNPQYKVARMRQRLGHTVAPRCASI
jgi:serine/threonine protein kinase